MLQALPLVFVLAGLALYTVLGGADFGAGLWQLLAGRGERAEAIREHAHRSMGPVWEANHVWLIFVLTVFWSAYPEAFGSIASTLAVPLFIAALGVIFRGAAYALRGGARNNREAGAIDTVFAISSILTPFALGAAVGGIATGRVPVGNAQGHLFSSWLGPVSILVGLLAVASDAYLAAVYLAADAARLADAELVRAFRTRALAAGLLAGALAIAGLVVLRSRDNSLYHALVSGRALPALLVSLLAGCATLALVGARRYEAARYSASVAVAAVIAGWALARWPVILPGMTVAQAAAGHDALVALVVAVLAGGAILFPSLALLFGLALRGRFAVAEGADGYVRERRIGPLRPSLARLSVVSLVAGIGLLNFADAPWAHTLGLLLLFGFLALGFVALVLPLLAGESPDARAETSKPPGSSV